MCDSERNANANAKAVKRVEKCYPPSVRRRIIALKRLHDEFIIVRTQFCAEVHALACMYFKTDHQALFDKCSKIVSGDYDSSNEECEWAQDDEEKQKGMICSKMKKVKCEEEEQGKENINHKNDNVKGIPDFWLTIFKNVGMLAKMVQEYDEPILKHLADVKIKFDDEGGNTVYTIEFHFNPNKYFRNSLLTKEYWITFATHKSNTYVGPQLYKCRGSNIDWKDGKDVTVKLIKKVQQHKTDGLMRTLIRTIENESFFNYFNPPPVPEDEQGAVFRAVRAIYTNDLQLCFYLRERIIPRAVQYFTGEANDE